MNYLNEEDYIKAINDNPDNRTYQLLFAEYLQEKGEDNLAEGWRVLIEKGKKPVKGVRYETILWEDWNWFPAHGRFQDLFGVSCVLPLEDFREVIIDIGFSTFFGAMQAAAVAYVRYTYDENYGKECPVCEGTGIYQIPNGEQFDPIRYKECSNCNGIGFIR